MATKNTPAPAEAEAETTPALPEDTGRQYDPRRKVYVYDAVTGEKQPLPVPETWLDGRFPNLKEVPSQKAGN